MATVTRVRERPERMRGRPFQTSWSRGPSLIAAGRRHARKRAFQNGRLAKSPERGAHLLGEELRLFPGREVSALVDFVEVDEVGVGAFRPASRSLVLLARKDADGDWKGEALHVEEAALVLPIQARGGNPRVGQPVEPDGVEE